MVLHMFLQFRKAVGLHAKLFSPQQKSRSFIHTIVEVFLAKVLIRFSISEKKFCKK